jgi:diphthamide synthase (EF-2-diphthine--ammonia ligase)
MLEGGLKAVVTCVDSTKLPLTFAGRAYNSRLLADLPPDIDPCGERGEFHTFCFAGPMFSQPIAVRVGEIVSRDGFSFADILPDAA